MAKSMELPVLLMYVSPLVLLHIDVELRDVDSISDSISHGAVVTVVSYPSPWQLTQQCESHWQTGRQR